MRSCIISSTPAGVVPDDVKVIATKKERGCVLGREHILKITTITKQMKNTIDVPETCNVEEVIHNKMDQPFGIPEKRGRIAC